MFSARLIEANTAFSDEALYLWAGHLEIADWLHGTPAPAFATYFSGSPVLYPPLGALADHFGGLAGARALSLAFMLGVTLLLYATSSRLFGPTVGLFSAVVFATLGVTFRLGAFATYDAMALLLVAVATYAAVRAAETAVASGWLVASAAFLVLANATKYATGLFDPVVIGLLFIVALRNRPLRPALRWAATMVFYVVCMLALAICAGGGEYIQGIEQTTLLRQKGTNTSAQALVASWHLIGLVAILAAAGALVCLMRRFPSHDFILLGLCVVAVALVPLEQAHLHTVTSLTKHVDFGAFYAAIPAGCLFEAVFSFVRRRAGTIVMVLTSAAALAVPLYLGVSQSQALFRSWPNSTRLVDAARKPLDRPGAILAEQPQILSFYLPQGTKWYRWSSAYTIRLPHDHTVSAGVGTNLSPSVYRPLIADGYFSVVELEFGPTASLNRALVAQLRANPHYKLLAHVKYGRRGAAIWQYEPVSHVAHEMLLPDKPSITFVSGLFAPFARANSGVVAPVVWCVEGTGALTLLVAFGIRFGWRRRKAVTER